MALVLPPVVLSFSLSSDVCCGERENVTQSTGVLCLLGKTGGYDISLCTPFEISPRIIFNPADQLAAKFQCTPRVILRLCAVI